MLTSLQLQRFKGHRDTTIPLGRITMLVGPNGAGKTSVLQALRLMDRLLNADPHDVLQNDMSPQDLLCRAGAFPISATLQGSDNEAPWRLTVSFSPPEKNQVTQGARFDWAYGEHKGYEETISIPFEGLSEESDALRLSNLVGPAALFHFDARQIAAVAYSTEENPWVEEDGRNTATVLAALKLEQEELFDQIEAELRRVVPSVQRVLVRRVKIPSYPYEDQDRIGHKIFLDFVGAPNVPAHAASEGTLITLALLTALFSPNRPRLLLLDDIDQSLHPQAQMEFMRQLKRLLKNFPEVQLVATTHSPYILDELDPSEVRVFALRKDGSVACRSLSSHPQAEKMRGVLTSGQLWSLDPEWRWVLEER
ncbi:MAG TPA: AAA family ATPase [Myxococcaceae bacterium]|jgi:predicted ATPase